LEPSSIEGRIGIRISPHFAPSSGILAGKRQLTDHQKRETIRRRDIDSEPVREIVRSYNVSHRTISRLSLDDF
jgi:hypothetical protein